MEETNKTQRKKLPNIPRILGIKQSPKDWAEGRDRLGTRDSNADQLTHWPALVCNHLYLAAVQLVQHS